MDKNLQAGITKAIEGVEEEAKALSMDNRTFHIFVERTPLRL
jgi:hypothetical protein